MSKIFYHISILSSLILLTRCGTVTANNAEESYRRWAGQPIPKEVKVLKGHYWQSGHWSREYTVYLKLRPTKSWWSEFVKQNKLVSDTIQDFQFGDAPKW